MASTGHGQVRSGKAPPDDKEILVYDFLTKFQGSSKPELDNAKRSRRRCVLTAVVVSVLVLLVAVVGFAVVRLSSMPECGFQPSVVPHPHLHFEKWSDNSKDGVTMYPKPDDGTVLIKYDSRSTGSEGYQPYLNSLEYRLHDYQLMNQHGEEYTACSENNTPPNKVCQFEMSVLKPCDSFTHFGYAEGRPCVMLQLNLPINKTAVPFGKDSDVAKKLGDRYNPDYIGVTCDGETEDDRKYLDPGTTAYRSVDYYLKEGFPSWWFRPRTIDKFLPPIVMVQFNTVENSTYVRIKCTAWGQNFNNGRPDNSTLYSTTFVINHI